MDRVAFIGNCQVEAIAGILEHKSNYTNFHEIQQVLVIHNISRSELLDFYDQSLKDLDILYCQHISDGYRLDSEDEGGISVFSLNYVREIAPSTCRIVVLPNMYFSGYFPEMTYLYDEQGKHVVRYGISYHDKNVINRYVETKCLNAIIYTSDFYDADFYDEEYIMKRLETNWEQMEKRELYCDVKIYPYIRDNYSKIRLFNTINHPTGHLLTIVCRKLMDYINLDCEVDFSDHGLDDVVFPIYESVTKVLRLKFKEDCYVFKNTRHEIIGGIQRYLNFYDSCVSYDTLKLNAKQ